MPLTFTSSSSQVGGGFAYFNTGDDFGALTSSNWDFSGNAYGDAWFKASFNSASVPEAASWTLMLIGFGAVGAAMRSRRVAIRFA